MRRLQITAYRFQPAQALTASLAATVAILWMQARATTPSMAALAMTASLAATATMNCRSPTSLAMIRSSAARAAKRMATSWQAAA
jgi:hypothetical protein